MADFHLHARVLAAAEMLRYLLHYDVNSQNYVCALAVSDIFTSLRKLVTQKLLTT